MRLRRYIIAGIVLILVIIVALFIHHLTTRPHQVKLYRATPGGSNIQFPYLAGPDTVDFFTGSGFAAYNTKTQTTSNISPQFILPTVTAVSWSKSGILFKADDYSFGDDLYTALDKMGLPKQQEYWWQYSFDTQKLSIVLPAHLQNNIVDAYWNAVGSNYAYISTDGSLYTSDNPKKAVSKVSDGTRIKQFSGSTITIAENGTITQVNTKNGSQKTLVEANFQDSYVSPDSQTVSYVLTTKPKSKGLVPGDLYKVGTTKSDKARRVLKDFGGVMAGNDGNLYVGYADKSGLNKLSLFPAQGKSTNYSLGASLNKGDVIGSLLPVSTDRIYVVSKSGNLVQVSDQQAGVSTPVSYKYKIQTDLYENGFEIHYDPYKNTYAVNITTNPFLSNQTAALKYIQAQSVDPNQIRIVWGAYDGVNTTNPAVQITPGVASSQGE